MDSAINIIETVYQNVNVYSSLYVFKKEDANVGFLIETLNDLNYNIRRYESIDSFVYDDARYHTMTVANIDDIVDISNDVDVVFCDDLDTFTKLMERFQDYMKHLTVIVLP